MQIPYLHDFFLTGICNLANKIKYMKRPLRIAAPSIMIIQAILYDHQKVKIYHKKAIKYTFFSFLIGMLMLLSGNYSFAQSKVIPVTRSELTGIPLPAGSKQDHRLLSTAAAKATLELQTQEIGITLGEVIEVFSLAPSAGEIEKQVKDQASQLGWSISPLPNTSHYYYFKKDNLLFLGYLQSFRKETVLYLCPIANTTTESLPTNSNPTQQNQLPPANAQTTTPSIAAVRNQSTFNFVTTNFDDGWVATARNDWVEVTKAGIKVLIHFHTKETSAYISDYREEDRLAWNTFIVPRYGLVPYTEGPSTIGFERPHFLFVQAREPESGQMRFVVLFKMGQSNWMEFIAPDQNSFSQVFGINIHQVDYYATTTFDPLRKMDGYNKFAVAPADLTGRWSSSFGGFTNYVNVYTGATSTDTHSSAEWFAFREDGTYDWQLSTASGLVGNIKFDGAKSSGKFTMPNPWQINFSKIENKERLYNAYFSCGKGARILWLQDTGYGGYKGFGKE